MHAPEHLPHPAWEGAFDHDPELALATRLAWLAALADQRRVVVWSHLAGIGRVVRAGAAFAWQPRA